MKSCITTSVLIGACIALWTAPSYAADEEEGPWSGKAAVGYLATSGNTENSNLNTSFEVAYKTGKWTHGLNAFAVHATETGATTAEAYELAWKSERNLTEHDFLDHKLNAEIGLGARQSELSNGSNEDEFIVRGGLNYQWLISETSEFTQDFAFESGDENTYLESVSALKARLIGNLALVASYTIKNNSDVPVGTENTDTYSALSLEYAF
jgi:putative salt-induced outer membrane protein